MSVWPNIHQFVRQRSKAFDRKSIPVPLDAIRMAEQGFGIRFPQTYVDFLTTAGEVSGGPYLPFGCFNTNFYDIVEDVARGTPYPSDRYWPVGLQIDYNRELHYPFIDLARSDGEDAPLVTFDPGASLEVQEVDELRHTVAEELAVNAFAIFELFQRKFSTMFALWPERNSFADALDYLELFGATETVRVSPRLRIFEGPGPVAVAVFDRNDHIWFDLAGEDYQLCWRVVNVLRDNIPSRCSQIDL